MHLELVVAKLVTMGLGLLIAYQAFRGYREHGSQPMLYVAIGFLFISVGAVVEGVLYDLVHLSIFLAGAIQTSIVAIGMIVILYSLYGGRSIADSADDRGGREPGEDGLQRSPDGPGSHERGDGDQVER